MTQEFRLYVGNLADDTTATALRRRFEECGAVEDVELAIDRGSGRMRGFAFVTMRDEAAKKSALTQLNGAMFEDQPLRVTESNAEDRENGGGGPRRSKKDAPRLAKVTSQFRERLNMAYEVDCGTVRLSFKMFPTDGTPGGTQMWRVEARSGDQPERVVEGNGATRKAAFDEITATWGDSELPWRAVEEALTSVRAL